MTMVMIAAVLAVFTFGMATVFPGGIKLRLVDRVSIDDAQMCKSITVWQMITLVSIVFVGRLLDRIGHRPILIASFVPVALAMWLFATAKHAPGVFMASALLGIGGSCVNSGGNTLLPALNTANPAAASNSGNGLEVSSATWTTTYLKREGFPNRNPLCSFRSSGLQ